MGCAILFLGEKYAFFYEGHIQKRRRAMTDELTRASQIIDSFGCAQSNLIAIMQEIQS